MKNIRSLKSMLIGSVMMTPMLISSHAMAQEDEIIEEITVTGIRGSQMRALQTKRNYEGVMDAISAEDIGKFPDQNISESLQRITGVSIDRNGGEGRFITVRGLGPQFNATLFNGRSIATENSGRQFSFDMLASELVSGVEVYKTNQANIQEGGIGATVNLLTAKPLDYDDFVFSASAKGFYDTGTNNVTPQVSALISNTFMDGRLGVLASLSYQKRKGRVDSIVTNNYNSNQSLNNLVDEQILDAFVPQNYDQIVDEQTRKRIGGTAVVQFQATNDFLITADVLYSDFKVSSIRNQLGHWFSPGSISDAVIDENRTVVAFTHDLGGFTDYISSSSDRPTKVILGGLNFDWDANDHLNFKLDLTTSQANTKLGDGHFTVIGTPAKFTYDFNNDGVPSLMALSGTTPLDTQVSSDPRAHVAQLEGNAVKDTVYEARFDGNWQNPDNMYQALNFGLVGYSRKKMNDRFDSSRPGENGIGCLYCGYATPAPGFLQAYNPDGGFFDDVSGDFPRVWQTYDYVSYLEYLQSPDAINASPDPVDAQARIDASDGYFTLFRQPSSTEVQEKIFGGYISVDSGGEFLDKSWSINLGLRYVRTESESIGERRNLLDLQDIPGDVTLYNAVFSESTLVSESNNYNNFLPNLSFKFDATDDLVLRASYSKSLTRPTLNQLNAALNFNVNRPGNLQAYGGNPKLQPFKANNFDLSAEWYYSDSSAFTIALFHKDISGFITSTVETETFVLPSRTVVYDVSRPRNGESAKITGLEVAWQHNFYNLPAPFDGLGFIANATFVDSNAQIDKNDTTQVFALEGLGNSQNLILFYEKDRVQFRVALNNREEFLQNIQGGGGEPVFVDGFAQLDISTSYDINNNFSVFLEGINVTNARTKRHGRFDNHFLLLQNSGARYSFGVRMTF